MVYVYRRAASDSARDLAVALQGFRTQGGRLRRGLRPGDKVVCWGEDFTPPAGVGVLNAAPIISKFEDAQRLTAAGVPTIEVVRQRPQSQPVRPQVDPALAVWGEVQEMAEEFGNAQFGRGNVVTAGITQLRTALERLQTALRNPAPTPAPARQVGEWLARRNNHIGGNDLLHPPTAPEYYAKKENLTREFRVHSFLGKSIRAGIKAPREGVTAHAWIRAYDAGWRIRYDGFSSTRAHRELAHRAVAALGLQFGAVDIGEKQDGSLIVLEVNRAPGLEGGTVTAYAEAVQRWARGETDRPRARR